MILLAVSFNSQCTSSQQVSQVIEYGEVRRATCLVNTKWNEFSAMTLAFDTGIEQVAFEVARDDTPGTLSLLIAYMEEAFTKVNDRIANIDTIETLNWTSALQID